VLARRNQFVHIIADMLDYLPVGSHGDPVLDFSRLMRDQTAALVEVTGEDFVDGRGENARELRRIRIKLARGSTRTSRTSAAPALPRVSSDSI
jgi:hypothetical protein